MIVSVAFIAISFQAWATLLAAEAAASACQPESESPGACLSSSAHSSTPPWRQASAFDVDSMDAELDLDLDIELDGLKVPHHEIALQEQDLEGPRAADPWSLRCNIMRLRSPGPREMLPRASVPYIVALPGRNDELSRMLQREELLQKMGNVTCTPSRAGSVRRGIADMPLGEYIEQWMGRALSPNPEENRYVFGEFGDQWAPLRDKYNLPPCRVCFRGKATVTIGLGGMHTGAPWHFHDAAFVEVLHGAKHFSLLPPGDPEIPSIDEVIKNLSQLHWHRQERPQLEREGRLAGLQECVLHPGEVLYSPPKWHHGVVNFDHYTA
eukprot:CAMPEP_0170580956 /NCGR_PEP_ID=MMETSP0224-20130122/6783_1 /TAXON_ID=285029 /ORGANISM="Togula jolla, Strain CCCM 725" /LENGTH=323 /DNA_ID=CAMNT_0010904061 /DNA_START=66 /DNA_END=1034 /DNA_ORIENTATION=+